jgi:hypothetical protein
MPECYQSGTCTICDILNVFLEVGYLILQFIGALALLFIIISGYLLMVSHGKKGRDTFKAAIIGFLIVLFAYSGVSVIISIFAGQWDWQAALVCGQPAPPPVLTQCADGKDNDNDGRIDYQGGDKTKTDFGCESNSDNEEYLACDRYLHPDNKCNLKTGWRCVKCPSFPNAEGLDGGGQTKAKACYDDVWTNGGLVHGNSAASGCAGVTVGCSAGEVCVCDKGNAFIDPYWNMNCDQIIATDPAAPTGY